jgi:hypothetical protein
MTGKHTLLLFKKERKKKQFKIVNFPSTIPLKSMIFAGFFSNDIDANIFQIIFDIDFCFGNMSETRKKI